MSKMSLLQEPSDVVPIPALGNRINVSRRLVGRRFFAHCSSRLSSLCTNVSTYLYDDMPRQSIDSDRLVPQCQRRHYLFSELLDVALNLPYPSLMEVAAAFGEMIDWQLLRYRAVDMVGKWR